MRDFDGAFDHIGVGKGEPKLQFFADTECPIDPQPNAFFGQVDHVAGEPLIPASDVAGSIDCDAKQLPLFGHREFAFESPNCHIKYSSRFTGFIFSNVRVLSRRQC